jgi:hypothetical protein
MKWLHNLLKGFSLTAALFVFQACYGTPPGYPEDYPALSEESASVDMAAGPADPLVDALPAEAAETGVPETETGE